MGIGLAAPAVLALALSQVQAPDPGPEPPQDFLAPIAAERGWHVESAADGSWVLYGSVDPALMRSSVELVDQFFRRLDGACGAADTPGTTQVGCAPVLLAFLATRDDQEAVCRALGEYWPHLKDWAASAAAFPRFSLFQPMTALVRHDPSTAAVQRPEVQIAHMAVQLELARRCGRLPFWVGEAVGYALQEENLDGVFGYTMPKSEVYGAEFPKTWRKGAHDALQQLADPARLVADGTLDFDLQRAYAQMGVARYWLDQAPEPFVRFLALEASARPATDAVDKPYEPDAAQQAAWMEQAFGSGWLVKALAANPDVELAKGPESRGKEVLAAVAAAAPQHKLVAYPSHGGRLTLWSDFDAQQARAALKSCVAVLKLLDQALGAPGKDPEPMVALLVKEEDAYRALCEAIGAADPRIAGDMRRFQDGSGFTIYEPLVTAFYNDVRVQEEARADASVIHGLAHLELCRRYGSLPRWLAEGVACACEDSTLGGVYGNWYRDGFVYTDSHGAWRDASVPVVTGDNYSLKDLFDYRAEPYQDDLAHFAFAFAVYGLEKERQAFAAFLTAMQKERDAHWTGAGRFEPKVSVEDALVHQAFGADFEQKFAKYWKSGPKAPKKSN